MARIADGEDQSPWKDVIRPHVLHFVYAVAAANFTSPVHYPFDTIGNRMILDSLYDERLYTSCIDCFTKVIQSEGIPGLYKGLYVTLFNQVLGYSIYYSFLAGLQLLMRRRYQQHGWMASDDEAIQEYLDEVTPLHTVSNKQVQEEQGHLDDVYRP